MPHNNQLVLALCGPGGSGKDTLAAMIKRLSQNTLQYLQSTSWYVAEEFFASVQNKQEFRWGLYPKLYDNYLACYNDRMNHRQAWAAFIDRFNHEDKARLYKLAIASGNQILTGIRKTPEFEACKQQGIIDFSIWLDPCVPDWRQLDSTQEYGPEACDIIIRNPRHTNQEEGHRLLEQKFSHMLHFFFNLESMVNAKDYCGYDSEPPLDGEFKRSEFDE